MAAAGAPAATELELPALNAEAVRAIEKTANAGQYAEAGAAFMALIPKVPRDVQAALETIVAWLTTPLETVIQLSTWLIRSQNSLAHRLAHIVARSFEHRPQRLSEELWALLISLPASMVAALLGAVADTSTPARARQLHDVAMACMSSNDMAAAASVIMAARLYSTFDSAAIIQALAGSKHSNLAVRYASTCGDEAAVPLLIKLVTEREGGKNAMAIVKRLDLNANDFPQLVAERQSATLRWLLNPSANMCPSVIQDYVDCYPLLYPELIWYCNSLYGPSHPMTRRFFTVAPPDAGAGFRGIHPLPPAELTAMLDRETALLPGSFVLPTTLKMVWVDTVEALIAAVQQLLKDDSVGFDCEWRMPETGQSFSRVALFQLACRTHVYIMDMLVLGTQPAAEMAVINKWFKTLFVADTIKYGFGGARDLTALHKSYPALSAFDGSTMTTVIDLSTCLRFVVAQDNPPMKGAALSDYCNRLLGAPLDKRQGCSDWERRPLRHNQMRYAAADAYCLILLADAYKAWVRTSGTSGPDSGTDTPASGSAGDSTAATAAAPAPVTGPKSRTRK